MEFKILNIGKGSYNILDDGKIVAKVNSQLVDGEEVWDAIVKYPVGISLTMSLFKHSFKTIESVRDFISNEVNSMKKVMGL
jgi:hypothetical protein